MLCTTLLYIFIFFLQNPKFEFINNLHRPSLETAKRSSEPNQENSFKRQRTEITSAVIQPNVIDVEDSDDDIEVLEQKLVKEKGNKDNRLYFEGGVKTKRVIK